MAKRGETIDDEDTSPYCKARGRLPESVPFRLMRSPGRKLHDQVPVEWLWCGRRVKVVNGTTVSMPDTPANQAAYPQSRAQKPGLGFPIARVVVVFCPAAGAVLEAAIGQYQGKQTGENALFRRLWDEYQPGDVSLGDRGFSSYFDIALLKQRGVDSVCRLHQARVSDYRRGRRLGREDHLVTWPKPARPEWMDEATYQAAPDEMEVRIVRIRVAIRGLPHAGAGRGDDAIGCGYLHEKGSGGFVSSAVGGGDVPPGLPLKRRPVSQGAGPPRISVTALLQLARWCQSRFGESLGQTLGGPPCPTPDAPPSPPRPRPTRPREPLTRAWSGLPSSRRREVLLVLSQIIAKGLPSAARKEARHEHR